MDRLMVEHVAKALLAQSNRFAVINYLPTETWESLQQAGRDEYLADAIAAIEAHNSYKESNDKP